MRRRRTLYLAIAMLVLLATALPAAETEGIRNTQNAQDILSTPSQALAAVQLPPGFSATLFANEPEVQNPIHFTFDTRGRLWVAENYTYAESSVGFAKDHRDRIVILHDSDNDGRCDQRTVFFDQADKLTSVAVGYGGVWALCAPRLLFIPDRDSDDVPDGEPIVVLDGWNDSSVRHNIVNGLMWGPDGWLYGRHGILATSLIGPPGTADADRVPINCGIWRYHPTRKVFEAVAHGTTNPWGMDFDEHGQIFFSNTVIGHLWHVVHGAHYERMYGVDFNPHLYRLMGQVADHFHWDSAELWSDVRKGMSDRTSQLGGGHAHCGLLIYQGDNWPKEYRGSMLTINLHGQRLNRDVPHRHGSGYVAHHAEDVVRFGDRWFRGIDLATGPDGGVFVADWTDVGECHENDGVHRTSGRIYKIVYGKPRRNGPANVAKLALDDLISLNQHPNEWYGRQARLVLAERAAAGEPMHTAHAALLKGFDRSHDVRHQLRAMWSLYVTGGVHSRWLREQLDHPQEHVRAWAVRLLADGSPLESGATNDFERVASQDSSALVRLFVASALQRMPLENRWKTAAALASRAEVANDVALSLMVWYGIEPAVGAAPTAAVSLVESSQLPIVRQYVARRITAEIESSPEAVATLVERLASSQSVTFQRDVLQGMNEALRGWQKAPQPTSWSRVSPLLLASGDPVVKTAAQELAVVFGDGRALDSIKQIALDNAADAPSRRQAVRVLVENRAEGLAPLLHRLLADRTLFPEAVRGLAVCHDPQTPKLIMNQYGRFDARTRDDAIGTLASRSEYARELIGYLESGRIQPRDISAYHVRQILSFGDAELRRRLTAAWGEIRDSSQERQKQIAALKQSLAADMPQADLAQGRAIYNKSCANCHVLYGQGAKVGPDLTGSNRKNLDYLLENIIDPSATVAANYRVSAIELKDGRLVNGVIVSQDARTLSVQSQREMILLAAAEVEHIVPQNLSLMPDGLLDTLSPTQTRDLMAYLSGSTQVDLPADGEPAANDQHGPNPLPGSVSPRQ